MSQPPQDGILARKRLREAVRDNAIRSQKLNSKCGRDLQERLLREDDFVDSTLQCISKNPNDLHQVIESFPAIQGTDHHAYAEAYLLVDAMSKFELDKDSIWASWLERGVFMNGSDSELKYYFNNGFSVEAMALSKPLREMIPQIEACIPGRLKTAKVPAYTALSGASGSGKTHTMLRIMQETIPSNLPGDQKCLNYYVSCNALPEETLFEYVKNHLKHNSWSVYSLDQFVEQCKSTVLVLVLDEVPGRWDHKCYHALPGKLEREFHFQKVILLVGSTALSQDVCRQHTADCEVLNIRMKPLQEATMPALLAFHLRKRVSISDLKQLRDLADVLFAEMPILFDLMANHRCASLTADVIAELLGNIPMVELPHGWGRGNSAALLSMVACRYRNLNGFRNKTPQDCCTMMLQSLALLAAQPVVEPLIGVAKHPNGDSLAESARALVEIGLVERAILPDEKLSDPENVKVDGRYEFQMSPALTLVCVTTILPWLEGIHSAADHFEALVAVLVVAMRYAQTGKLYSIHCLAQAVPYSGKEQNALFEPATPILGKCFINGPQAPYADLMLSGVVPLGEQMPEHVSKLSITLSNLEGTSDFPAGPLLVQCKLTFDKEAKCTFRDEYAKMGLVDTEQQGDVRSVAETPAEFKPKRRKQYESGRWLTRNWVGKGDSQPPFVVFATNKVFKADELSRDNVIFMEGEGDYSHAWQELYPVKELVRDLDSDFKGGIVGRKRYEWPSTTESAIEPKVEKTHSK